MPTRKATQASSPWPFGTQRDSLSASRLPMRVWGRWMIASTHLASRRCRKRKRLSNPVLELGQTSLSPPIAKSCSDSNSESSSSESSGISQDIEDAAEATETEIHA
eukprot:7948894-Pyramimonas_sp.AAC.1